MVSDLDDPVEKEKLHQNEVQKKYELLEERLRAMEGINIPKGVDAAELTVIMVFRSTLMIIKINGVATDLFCIGVISQPGCVFLN